MSRYLQLAALCCAVSLTACGGGGGGGDEPAAAAAAPAAPSVAPQANTSAPAPSASSLTSAANCPTGGRSFTLTNAVVAAASTSMVSESTTLSFKTPLTAITLKMCVAQRGVAGFPETPPALAAVMTGQPSALVFADGQYDQLSNKQLALVQVFDAAPAADIAAKKLVSYTPTASGSWIRTVLDTTQSSDAQATPAGMVSVKFTAPFTSPGFFKVE